MMLMLLLTELARLEVHLSVASDGLHVQAPTGVLTDELRQAMIEHKTALLRYAADPAVETIDGLGYLTGNRQEQDVTFTLLSGKSDCAIRSARCSYKMVLSASTTQACSLSYTTPEVIRAHE